jgi:hypothetical protein
MRKFFHHTWLILLSYFVLGLVAVAGLGKTSAGFLYLDHSPKSPSLRSRRFQPDDTADVLFHHAYFGGSCRQGKYRPAARRRSFMLLALRGGSDRRGDSDQKPVNFTKARKKLFETHPISSDHLSYPLSAHNPTMVHDNGQGDEDTRKKEKNQHANKDVDAGPSDTPELSYKFVPPERVLHSTQYEKFTRPGIINKQMWAACETGDDEELEAIMKHLKADVNAVDENIYNYTVSGKTKLKEKKKNISACATGCACNRQADSQVHADAGAVLGCHERSREHRQAAGQIRCKRQRDGQVRQHSPALRCRQRMASYSSAHPSAYFTRNTSSLLMHMLYKAPRVVHKR